MTVCDICEQLFDGINDLCPDCQYQTDEYLNRECQQCGGYELDDEINEICYCNEEEIEG